MEGPGPSRSTMRGPEVGPIRPGPTNREVAGARSRQAGRWGSARRHPRVRPRSAPAEARRRGWAAGPGRAMVGRSQQAGGTTPLSSRAVEAGKTRGPPRSRTNPHPQRKRNWNWTKRAGWTYAGSTNRRPPMAPATTGATTRTPTMQGQSPPGPSRQPRTGPHRSSPHRSSPHRSSRRPRLSSPRPRYPRPPGPTLPRWGWPVRPNPPSRPGRSTLHRRRRSRWSIRSSRGGFRRSCRTWTLHRSRYRMPRSSSVVLRRVRCRGDGMRP